MGPTSASVLIVDDNADVRQALRLLIESAGVHVCDEAKDGVEAIAKASANNPGLIFMDVSMPNLDGIKAASIIHRNLPETYRPIYDVR